MKVDHGVTISSNLASFFSTSTTSVSGNIIRLSVMAFDLEGVICRTNRFHAFELTKDGYTFLLGQKLVHNDRRVIGGLTFAILSNPGRTGLEYHRTCLT